MEIHNRPNPLIRAAKSLVPSREMQLPILFGPFRGGSFYSNVRHSLRRVLGLYESELNGWLARAMRHADVVLDVGANDGYFTFGAAAAMRRADHAVKVVAFEPVAEHVAQLEAARSRQNRDGSGITVVPKMVGDRDAADMTRLDSCYDMYRGARPLIKIDVEGAEIDVLEGAGRWLTPQTMLLIEVHEEGFIDRIRTMLAGRTAPLELVHQRALPLLGLEQRGADNWWLVSKLD